MPGTTFRILVVDDHPLITQSVCDALEVEGYAPRPAFNGQQALEEVEREAPDLMILDVMMPLLDGLGVLKAVRSDPATREIPVIMLTALDTDKEMLKAMNLGATMYVTKPVAVPKLVRLVGAVLGGVKRQ